ncbi:hypothetical protein EXM30_09165 [Clostridium botulinum]|uniref:hypothetical protein n=1 Tax=Clostridium botulinum TaxID=1491 RepID=UPI0007DF7A50|nr:hypothetical protein [Clostridium botulinum]KEI80100.1 hypothetical protein N487_03825 [Clostridium botulinum B2 331]NFA89635.1 hypothetical protein [Clostridium botulinum]NFB20845.1 hypothetical protein [Clostridium botulinum]NFI39293.1 hypothetical protein [Clostridium botulinum]NFT55960.1 hypothetical protein [Clostridium botulinum]
MKLNLNEDDILMLLNDITINENEFSDVDLNEIEKKKICENIISKVQPKKSKSKRNFIAAAVILLISIPLLISPKNVLANMLEKLTVISGIGEVNVSSNKPRILKNSLKKGNITLANMYVDNNKIIVTLTIEPEELTPSYYTVRDEHGNSYELHRSDNLAMMPDNHIGSYRAEYYGEVKKANKYTLNIIDNDKKLTKATFKLKNSHFKEAPESKILYTATNGITILNVTSLRKEGNILKVDYYFTDTLPDFKWKRIDTLNYGTFEEGKKWGLKEPINTKLINNNPTDPPNVMISDEYNNAVYGHNNTNYLDQENESLFDLRKLTGKKLKLTVLNVNYSFGNDYVDKNNSFKLDNDFKLELDVPKSGRSILNKTGEYKGIKYKIISIERLSNNSVELIYNYINDNNTKLQTHNISFDSITIGENGESVTKPYNNNIKHILKLENGIGDKLQLNNIRGSFSSVGPFEIDLDPSTIK